ncbi:MAG: hypothetical protein ACI8RZ_003088 [Myxococcota bacterium]
MRRWLGRLLLVAGGLLVGVVGAEVLSRMVRPDASADLLFGSPESSPMGLYVIDHQTLLTPRPGFTGTIRSPGYAVDLRINEIGLRGPSTAEVTGKQWLAVGDSFTMSVQVPEEETFAGQLSGPVGAHIWNAGVDGFSTWQAAIRYAEIDEVQPVEQVVLTFFLGNDFQDNANFLHQIRNPPPMAEGSDIPRETMPPVTRFLLRHSHLYAHWRVLQRRATVASGEDHTAQRWKQELMIFSTDGGRSLTQLSQETEKALRKLRDDVKSRGDALLVAVAPPAFVIETDRAEATFEVVGLDTARMDLDAPRRAALDILRKLNIPACDLTDPLKTATEAGGELYFVYDGHWTADGHQVVAETLEGCL